MPLTVTEDAVIALRALADHVSDLQSAIRSDVALLLLEFEQEQKGLGAHSGEIEALLTDLQTQCDSGKRVLRRLVRRLRTSADLREAHRTGTFPAAAPASSDTQTYLSGVLGRIYESGYQKLRKPTADGTWKGDRFLPDANYKPTKYHPHNSTCEEILRNLEETYGIRYTGTPFVEGFADFSQIALAQIGLDEIAAKHDEDFLIHCDQLDFGEVFSSRSQNLHYADEIAAEKQLPIPGLPAGYSAADLTNWRKIHHFTWDESYLNGYLLVPSEIHNNIPHTGLVGVSGHGTQAEQTIAKRWASMMPADDGF